MLQLRKEISDYEELMRSLRRQLHTQPELSDREYDTQEFIIEFLKGLKLDEIQSMAETGVKGVILTPGASETLGFRADMDALYISEQNNCSYASKRPGIMHACGHDGHMALLLGLARWCSEHRDSLKYNIVFIFQPGEEGTGGAVRMIKAGVLENPRVDRLYGYHLMPEMEIGKIAVVSGPLMAGACEFDIKITGRSAHGAAPYKGIDALAVASECYLAIQNILTRTLPPDICALITVGRLSAGTRRNIVAGEALMECTMRTFEEDTYAGLKNRIIDKITAAASSSGAKAEFIEHVRYPAVVNPSSLAVGVVKLLETDALEEISPLMIAEDFSFYQKACEALFMFLGCSGSDSLHSAKFDFDESALLYGLELYIRIIEN